jgi:DNA modification methylase
MLAFALRADGWYLRSDIIWHKPNPMPESVTDRPTKAHEYLFLLTKSAKYFYDADAIREPDSGQQHNRSFITPAEANAEIAASLEPSGGLKGAHSKSTLWGTPERNGQGRNKRSVWQIATEPTPEAHFATFPKKLVEPCILAGTSEKGCCVECGAPWERVVEKKYKHHKNWFGDKQEVRHSRGSAGQGYNELVDSKTTGWKPGCECLSDDTYGVTYNNPGGEDRIPFDTEPCTVLDPFLGSGKTALVAYKHRRRFVGIELSKTYLDEIAIPKIKKERKQRVLF